MMINRSTRPASDPPEAPSAAARLARFVPRFQKQQIAAGGTRPIDPTSESGWGAVLFIDISGFTAITERLALEGPRGAEILSELLNHHYGWLTDRVADFGGDIVAFAGDALLALWWAEDAEGETGAALAAARCALSVVGDERDRPDSEVLAVRLSLSAGPLVRYRLGGVSGRWYWLVSGALYDDLANADGVGASGEIILTTEAATRIDATSEPVTEGLRRLVALPSGGTALPVPASGDEELSVEALAPFLPDVVRDRILAEQDAFLAEFRVVTVVFIALPASGSDDDLASLQATITALQGINGRYGGELYQCLRDEKGLSAILAFGVPPQAHENDGERALLSALAAYDILEASGTAIGVATGRMFCGAYGGTSRQQYSLMGGTINLAARLMAAAKHGILCDATTAATASSHLQLRPAGRITAKGIAGGVETFRPQRVVTGFEPARRSAMVGREHELNAIKAALVKATAAGPTAPVIIEAEAGMGKSTLVAAAIAEAGLVGLRVVVGHADPIEQNSPHHPFRDILDALFPEPGELGRALRAHVAGTELEAALPLLGSLRPELEVAPRSTPDFTAAVRLEKINALLLTALALGSAGRPTLLVVEDGHWVDSASWSLLRQAVESLPDFQLLLTTRPMDEPPAEYLDLREVPHTLHLSLDSLAREALLELVRRHLEADTLPEAFAALLVERSEGNPFYALEIAFALRDQGEITITEGRLSFSADTAFDGGRLPSSLQGVITSRIDRLPAHEQLTLKVASVIGRVFDLDMLRAIHPQDDRRNALPADLGSLAAANLIVAEASATGTRYMFRHAVILDCVYDVLAYANRKTLHASAAAYVAAEAETNDAPSLSRLAHHYSEADMPVEAVAALQRAGEHAVATFANREGVRFLRRALDIYDRSGAELAANDRIQIHEQLSQAYYGLTDYSRSLKHTALAVRTAGYRAPAGVAGIALEVGVMGFHALRRRLTGRRSAGFEPDRRDAHMRAMAAIGVSLPALLLLGRSVAFLESTLRLHNMAARIEPSAMAGAARSGLGLCLGMMGLSAAAEKKLREGVAEVATHGNANNLAEVHMLLGMFLHMRGALEEARSLLDEAYRVTADEPGQGLSHLRIGLNLGAVLDALREVARADEVFSRMAATALQVEPQVCGLMVTLRAANLLHAGDAAAARPLLEEGLARSRDHEGAMHIFTALGVQAECELLLGRPEAALRAATEATTIALAHPEDVNTYVHAVNGYSGALMALLEAGTAAAPGGPNALELAARLGRLFKRFAGRFVVCEPRYQALEGLRRLRQGNGRAAARLWRDALSGAERMGLAYELGLARYYLEAAESGGPVRSWGTERAER